jgi:TonB family protein
MSITKLQVGLASALAVAGATGFVVQAETSAAMRDEASRLRRETEAIAGLRVENQKLATTAAEVNNLRADEMVLAQLRDEAATLKRQVQASTAVPVRAAAAPTSSSPTALSGPVYDISKLSQTPKAKFQARPNYPAELRTSGTEGQVVVDFVVDDKGNVQNAFAARSSQREFEAAAVDAVSKWKFVPGEISGASVNSHMQVPIVFTIAKPNAEGEMPAKSTSTFWF